MKKLILYCLFMTGVFTLNAQRFTFEYNAGYGLYNMSVLKNFITNNYYPPVNGLIQTDNFPGGLINDFRIGVITGDFQYGMSGTWMYTGAQKGLSDYSGEFSLQSSAQGMRWGLFGRYDLCASMLKDSRFQPYIGLTSGVIFNRLSMKTYAQVYEYKETETIKMKGINISIEPTVGVKILLQKHLVLNVGAGYDYHIPGKLYLDDDSMREVYFKLNWQGLRAQAGLILIL